MLWVFLKFYFFVRGSGFIQHLQLILGDTSEYSLPIIILAEMMKLGTSTKRLILMTEVNDIL